MLRKKVLIAAIVAGFVMLFSSNLYAQSFSLGLKGSTLGVGVEAGGSINDTVGGRIGANYLKYNYSGSCGDCDVDLDYEINSSTFPILFDWHPMQGSFRISGGVVFSNSNIEGDVSYSDNDTDTVEIGDTKYAKKDIGKLSAAVDFKKTNPYLGLGWDTSFGKNKRFGFICDLGVIFQGSPAVELSASGPIASNATFQSDLKKEEDDWQDSLDKWKYYPLLAAGVSYRF